jgi:anti-sigma factor RsiW
MSTDEESAMELLSAFIDGELAESEKEKVSSFLSNSPEGRKELDRLKHTKALLMNAPPVKVPPDFLDALELRAEMAMKWKPRRLFWSWSNPWAWAPSLGFAVAAYFVAVGLRPPPQIPFKLLMAAHETVQSAMGVHQAVVAASHCASQIEG